MMENEVSNVVTGCLTVRNCIVDTRLVGLSNQMFTWRNYRQVFLDAARTLVEPIMLHTGHMIGTFKINENRSGLV